MMERLTFDGNFCDIAQCRELPCTHGGSCTQRQVWDKLKAYEDLGFEPEDYKRVAHGYFVHDGPRFAGGVDWWHCSNCGRLTAGVETRFAYCPNCGARMDGDGDGEED